LPGALRPCPLRCHARVGLAHLQNCTQLTRTFTRHARTDLHVLTHARARPALLPIMHAPDLQCIIMRNHEAVAPPAAAGRRCRPCRGRGAARPPRPRRAAPRRAGPTRAPRPPPARPARARARAEQRGSTRGALGACRRLGARRLSCEKRMCSTRAAAVLIAGWSPAGHRPGCANPGPDGTRHGLKESACLFADSCAQLGCGPPPKKGKM
jgi:hypothetical protein